MKLHIYKNSSMDLWNYLSMKCPVLSMESHISVKYPIFEMSCLWNVQSTLCIWNIHLWNVLSMKCPIYEMCCQWTVLLWNEYDTQILPAANISRFRLVLLNISRFRLDLLNISRFRLCLLKMIQVQIRPALNGKCYNWRYGGFSFELLPFECSFELLFIWIILTWRHILYFKSTHLLLIWTIFLLQFNF